MALSNNEVWADLELKYVIKEAVGGEKLGRACLGARHLHVTILHQVQLGVAPSYSCPCPNVLKKNYGNYVLQNFVHQKLVRFPNYQK